MEVVMEVVAMGVVLGAADMEEAMVEWVVMAKKKRRNKTMPTLTTTATVSVTMETTRTENQPSINTKMPKTTNLALEAVPVKKKKRNNPKST